MSNQTNENIPTQQNVQPQPVKARQQEDTIDLLELFYALWAKLWIILIAMVLGGGIAFAYTRYRITPLYVAQAKIYAVSASSNSVINLSDLQIGTQLTYDYQELIISRPLMEGVISKLNLNMSAGQLASAISVDNEYGTRILKIQVTHPDPQLAMNIANELCNQAIVYLPQVMGTEQQPNIVETAILPTSKASPNHSRNTLMGVMLGAVLCCGVITLRFLMDDTMKDQDDVFKYLGVQPLAVIPEADLGDKKTSKKPVTKKTGMKKKSGGTAR